MVWLTPFSFLFPSFLRYSVIPASFVIPAQAGIHPRPNNGR